VQEDIREEEMDVDEEEEVGPIRVVKDYVRPARRAALFNGQDYDPTKFAVRGRERESSGFSVWQGRGGAPACRHVVSL
jgi:hypothetical protein